MFPKIFGVTESNIMCDQFDVYESSDSLIVGGAFYVTGINEYWPFIGNIAMSEPDTVFNWLKRPKLTGITNIVTIVQFNEDGTVVGAISEKFLILLNSQNGAIISIRSI